MGNQPLCSKDTRDFRSSTYMVCGKQPQFRNSTTINIINYVPVVSGPPLNFEKQQTFKKVQKSALEFCQTNGLDPLYIPLVSRIIAYDHKNIFMAYRKLPQHYKQQFLQDIKYADIDFLDSVLSLQLQVFSCQRQLRKSIIAPSRIIDRQFLNEKERQNYYQTGKNMLANGQVAFFFLCAGSSSRFLFQDKFMYPLQIKSGKALIELLLERLKRNLKVPEYEIASVPIIFACSQNNRIIVQNFLSSKKYCGFDPTKLKFLTIPNIPVLNPRGRICLTFEYKILNRPSGTAKCIQQFLGSGYFNWLRSMQINAIHIVGCENLIQNPGDPLLLGLYRQRKLQIVSKCTQPLFPTQQFNRYSGSNDGKIYLINPEQILNSKMNENIQQALMQKCPIAMNSIVCGINQLKNMTREYQNSLFLSLQYIAYKKNQNYYDFQKEKPLVSSPVYVFQKQIGNLLTCSTRYNILKVPRQEYIPILTKNGSYSIKEACRKLIQIHESSLNFSRVRQ